MKDFNGDRVICYGRNDLAAGIFKSRCIDLLINADNTLVKSVNDAIEMHQCKLTVEQIPELFESFSEGEAERLANILFSKSCAYVNRKMNEIGLCRLYGDVELQYKSLFWNLLRESGATKAIVGSDMASLLLEYPACLGDILENKILVNRFGCEIKEAMVVNPEISVSLIISRLAVEDENRRQIFLPSCLTSKGIDSLMMVYLDEGDCRSGKPNPNYAKALFNWPGNAGRLYSPSRDVRVKARRVYDASTEEMFKDGGGIRYGSGVVICSDQVACKDISRNDFTLEYSFSERWLEKYTDSATVMNNLIYIFDFVDSAGMMTMPAHAHEESGLLAAIGIHVQGEYRMGIGSQMKESLSLLEVVAYNDFLKRHATRLEDALEWVYREYFPTEYGIEGFSLSLPAESATWLDKCKCIGPEIERVVKSYSLYSEYGSIDGDYFPYEDLKAFSTYKSMMPKKYAIAGSRFEPLARQLFSDQCLLSYRPNHDDDARCFYDLMRSSEVFDSDYPEIYLGAIEELIGKNLVCRAEDSGALLPTMRAACMKRVWDDGAIYLNRFGMKSNEAIDELVSDDILAYSRCLFSPDEADYLNYMYNNALFSNSRGLRNKHDHANAPVDDPNADEAKEDYYRLLILLIEITLKINFEFSDLTGQGGIEDFVDWPLYGENIRKQAKSLSAKRDDG